MNANIAALNASRNLSSTNVMLGKSLEKLSSGYRINRAADDAAGLAISENLRSEIRGSQQAQRNAQDGISFLQTAEGAMSEIHSMLQRMRELAVQANNGTSDGQAEQAEVTSLLTEIKSIAGRTKFNGEAVFQDQDAKAFQIGSNAGDQLALTGFNLEIDSDTTDPTAGDFISGDTVLYGDVALTDVVENYDAAGLFAIDITADGGVAQDALAMLDDTIKAVSYVRGSLGAMQNRLESTVANLGVAVENLTASESRIRDVDMAAEMVTYTRNNILSQAGTAMLAQANQIPQGILGLLR
ncbi:MAG: flagellin [Ilumatobacteraceae bacterium]